MRYPMLYHEADTENDPQGGASKVRASELRSQLGTNVDETALMRLLEKQADNSQLREQRRTLRQEVTDLKSKAAPEGTRVLSTDEAKAYDAYAALGKPDDLRKAIDLNGEATAKLARLEREQLLGKAASAAGFKSAVLQRLAGDLPIEIRDVDGKPAAFVKDATGETPLTEYATTAWADFLPALQVEAQQGGTSYVNQSAGDKLPPQNPAQAYINRNYKKQEST
jgi:hypothetical protein